MIFKKNWRWRKVLTCFLNFSLKKRLKHLQEHADSKNSIGFTIIVKPLTISMVTTFLLIYCNMHVIHSTLIHPLGHFFNQYILAI